MSFRIGPNVTIRHNSLVFVKLTQGRWAIIDEADYKKISDRRWCAHRNGNNWYAESRTKSKDKAVLMHRVVLNMSDSKEVDHINGNGLDNRSRNLRACSHSCNIYNIKKRRGASKFKGVGRCKRTNKWTSRISKDGKYYWLGLFCSEVDAANAYNLAAKRLFGEFAGVNII